MSAYTVHRQTTRLMSAQRAEGHSDEALRCPGCGTPTSRADMSSYGARCRRCFDDYGARPLPAPPTVPADAVPPGAGRRDWAYRLRWREQHGERLTRFQRDAWRRVLRAHGVLDAAKAGRSVPTEAITRALRDTGDIQLPDDVPIVEENDA